MTKGRNPQHGWRLAIMVLVAQFVGGASLLVAQEATPVAQSSKKSDSKVATKSAAKPSVPVVDENAALQFAATHHPELADLLQTLRKSNKQQFQVAINELSRDRERIERLAERDTERAVLMLQSWKVDSRIRLEVARFTMTQDSEREARIKELLKERADTRRLLLELDHRRTQQRLAKLDEQVAQQKENSEKQLVAEWERLKKSVAGQAKSKPRTETKKKE